MIYETDDRKIFASLIHLSLKDSWAQMPPNELILKVGKYFLGTPYIPSTLETSDTEGLVINLRQMDCFTYIENVMVLTRLIRDKGTNIDTFAAILQKVRYRGGVITGYASRLHYFSDWLYDNQLKGFLVDITEAIGGKAYRKKISYITKHPDAYPSLHDPSQYSDMLLVEENLRRRSLHWIQRKDLSQIEYEIKDGDLIGITAAKTGLDVVHAAIVIRIDGMLHLLHASQTSGQVMISTQNLTEYLEEKKERTGIMVGRIL